MFSMKKSCLVLGGSGFLGSHLCEALVLAGYHVRALVPEGFSLNNLTAILNRVEILRLDMNGAVKNDEIWGGVNLVFHLACTTRPQTSNDSPARDVEENVVPTLRILDRCVANKIRRLVFVSSGGTVYGPPCHMPIREDHPTAPICAYGIHKLAIEHYLHLYETLHGLDYRVARVANVYGERQTIHGNQGLVGTAIEKIEADLPIPVYGNGEVVRDYIHVSDVVNALLCLASTASAYKTFNVGSGNGNSVMEIIQAVEKALGLNAILHFQPIRPLDVPKNVLDIARIQNETGWVPKLSLQEGITRTVIWWRAVQSESAHGQSRH